MDAPRVSVIKSYLDLRPRHIRTLEWLRGRRYLVVQFLRFGASPIDVVIAHHRRDSPAARKLALALESDWLAVPAPIREAYEGTLSCAPATAVVDLRRTNRCGCLGHRHPVVREEPFAEPHEYLGGRLPGEMDIAWQRVEAWPALPLEEAALDARFFEGSRLDEFRARQFRLRLLSVFLHETHHIAFPHDPEESVRQRSLTFYRDALHAYVDEACATLSFTIDRSFSRME